MGRRGVERIRSELEGGLVHEVSALLGWREVRRMRRCGGM